MSTCSVFSQNKSVWQKQTTNNFRVKPGKQNLPKTQTFSLDISSFKQSLEQVPRRGNPSSVSNVIVSIPNAEGVFERFRVYEASNMHPDLAERYPEIKSYAGQGIDDPSSVIRFSVTQLGFQSMRLSGNKPATFIEAISEDMSVYTVFTRAQRLDLNNDFECSVVESMNNVLSTDNQMFMRNADDGILRNYRLAVSTTGEYTVYHGGTKADALAAINQTMTRVNGIFEIDFNVNMTLIANTDDVIYLDGSNDPYGGGSLNNQLQSTLTTEIGEANYDVGHLFGTGGNSGNAGCIGCVCVNGQKGSGWTTATVPEGEAFDVDYVAHELGHQFGANHTHTHAANEGSGVQAEPGSGTTIMSYAGITGASTDVENNVTPNFHALNIEQVTDYVKSTSCDTETITGNAVPVVTVTPNYTIPNGTPFILDGSATDADTPSNQLSYVWEQIDDNGNLSTFPSPTKTGGVMFRAYAPVSETFRYFPRLETIKTGATSWQWEAIPTVARTLNFRLTVRDNVVGGGTNNSADVVVDVNGTAGPFVVTAPNTNISWEVGATETISWDVAGTTGNGVNAANVDIFLSTDGGDTYPITLASGVTNDGSHDIVVPNNQGTTNRVMVRGANNIFFDISDADFTIAVCNANVPTGLMASNVVDVSASLSWDIVSGASYDIRYREVGSTGWTTTSVNENSIDLTGLSVLTQYEAQVRSKCNGGINSAYSGSVTFTTTDVQLVYCNSNGDTQYETGVTRVVFGTIDNADGPLKDVGYEDFTNISTTVNQTSTVDLTVNVNTDGNFTVHAFAWIDWNQNGDFTDSGEEYDLGSIQNVLDGALPTLPILIPSNAQLGNTTMRVSARYNSDPTPCLVDFDGEVEDYTIIVDTPGPDTEAPVITLNGSATIDVGLGGTYSELGATAVDNVDGDISANIVIGGDTVDTNTLGAYVLTYNVSDAAGNDAVEVTRTVNVIVPTYCDSFGNTTYDTSVTRVIFGSIDNVDAEVPKDAGYEDFTNISTDVVQGSTVDLTVHVNTDGNFVVHAFVWIDWNMNGDFDDPGESYDLGDIQNESDGALPTISVTIPESMNFGTTRMRVSAQYNADPTSCLTGFDGEVEDYSVNVKYDGLLYSGGTWDPSPPDGSTSADNVLILDGIYNTGSDISINDLTVNTGATINIPETNNITVGGDIDVMSNGELILNSSSTQFSSLLVDGTVTGNVKYNRHVTDNAGGNDLIAPPVSGEVFTSFISNNSNIFANSGQTLYLFGPFEKPLNDYTLFSNTETATLNAGQGYRAASTDNGTFTFEGAVTNSAMNIPLIYSGLDYAKWNLVGNPYTSYIKLEDFLMANLNELDPNTVAVYGYDADISLGTEWTIWNMAYSDNNPGALIAPGQGFFVSSKDDGSSSVIFNPSMRSTGNSDDFIAGRNANLAHFVINMSKPDRTYNTDVYLNNGASLGLDIGYDAELFEEEPSSFSIYTELTEAGENLNMAIQTIGFSDVNGSTLIPVGINLLQGQQVVISMNTSDVGYNVYFEDTLTNTVTLLNTSDYNLTANSDLMGTGRFYLRFEAETLSVTQSNLESVKVYNDTNVKQIVVEGQLTEDTTFVLYDIQGRMIVNTELVINTTKQTINTSNFSNGVYLVQLVNSSNTVSKKIIIK